MVVSVRNRSDDYVTPEDWSLFGNVIVDEPQEFARSKKVRKGTVSAMMPTTVTALREGPLADPVTPAFVEAHPDTVSIAGDPLFVVAGYVDLLLQTAKVRLVWSDTAPRLYLAPGSLLSALGLDLAEWVMREGNVALCTNCRRPFRPFRPRPGEKAWCGRKECKAASQRAATAAYRQRKRSEREQGDEP